MKQRNKSNSPSSECVLRLPCAAVMQGRGIVMVGGGLRYMESTWIGVHLIRRSGCRLPIEMW